MPEVMDPVSIVESQEQPVRELQRLLQSTGRASLVGPKGEALPLPEPVYDLLLAILRNLQEGKAISLVPYMQELTTQQAADILGVSRPFFVGLLADGKLRYHRVGTHRRVYLKDLLEYKKARDVARHEGLNQMARDAVAAGVYDKLLIPEDD